MKNKTINYPGLLRLMPIFFLLLVFLFYQFALKNTIAAYHSYRSSSKVLPESSKLSISPTYTAFRAKQVQQQYESFIVDLGNWKNSLWNTLTRLSQQHNCSVIAYPSLKTTGIDELQCYQQGVVFSGKFFDLLLMVKELEKMKGVGRLTAVSFIKKDSDKQPSLKIVMAAINRYKK